MFNLGATIIPPFLWDIAALHVYPFFIQANDRQFFFVYFAQLYKIGTSV